MRRRSTGAVLSTNSNSCYVFCFVAGLQVDFTFVGLDVWAMLATLVSFSFFFG